MEDKVKELEKIVLNQQQSIEKMQSLLKLLLDNVSKHGVRIECLVLDYSKTASSVEQINPNQVMHRLESCSEQRLRQDGGLSLN